MNSLHNISFTCPVVYCPRRQLVAAIGLVMGRCLLNDMIILYKQIYDDETE